MVKQARSQNAARSGEPRISDEAVRRATGRTWDEWIHWLDEREARRAHDQAALAAIFASDG